MDLFSLLFSKIYCIIFFKNGISFIIIISLQVLSLQKSVEKIIKALLHNIKL